MKIIKKVKLNVHEVIKKMKRETPVDNNPFKYFTIEQLESYADDLEFQIYNIKEKIKTVSSEKRKDIEKKLKDLESILDDITKTYNERIESVGNKISQRKSKRR